MNPTLDLFESCRLRDEGIARVSLSNAPWMDEALALAQAALPAGETNGELIKVHLLDAGLTPPKNSNAWGALIRTMALRGMLVDTERAVKAATTTSHARRLPVWIFRRG